MKKQYCWPEGHWNWPITVTHKHGVRCGEMICVGGQVDLDPEDVGHNQGNLAAQPDSVMRNLATVLDALHSNLPIRSSYFSEPGPAITGIPLPAPGSGGARHRPTAADPVQPPAPE